MSPPSDYRASAGVTSDGTLDVRRVTFFGTWQGAGGKRTLNQFNRPLKGNGIALYTQVWGPTTPPKPGAVSAILFPFPAATPNTDLQAPVVEVRTGGAAGADPARWRRARRRRRRSCRAHGGGTGRAARDDAAQPQARLARTSSRRSAAARRSFATARRSSGPARSSRRASSARARRAAPSASSRTGRMILVTVDGRQPGYSVGMTNFELAQALVRLGAVTGMALDSGGSATMAFDGTLLNRPVRAGAADLDRPALPVHRRLRAAGRGGRLARRRRRRRQAEPPLQGRAALDRRGEAAAAGRHGRLPGVGDEAAGPVRRPLPARRSGRRRRPSPTSRVAAATSAGPAQGRWTLTVTATDDIGQPSEMTQSFLVNTTIGFLATNPKKLFLPPRGRDVRITWKQTKTAKVTVTVETRKGEVLRTLAKRSYTAGVRGVTWNGLDRTQEGRQGRRLRRPRRRPEPARHDRPGPEPAGAAHRRPVGYACRDRPPASASRLSRCPWPRSRAR